MQEDMPGRRGDTGRKKRDGQGSRGQLAQRGRGSLAPQPPGTSWSLRYKAGEAWEGRPAVHGGRGGQENSPVLYRRQLIGSRRGVKE